MLLVVVAIVLLGILIIIHEGGHFIVARLSGMRVDRFSIGFGPAIASFKRGETTYQISAIPLGGFVQIAGLNPHEEGLAPDDPRAYPNRPVYQRLLTIFAGPGTNYLFAALLMAVIYVVWGVAVPGKMPMVGAVVDGRPAAQAGLKMGDEIVTIDDHRVKDMSDVAPIIDASQGKPVRIVVARDAAQKTFEVTPAKDGDRWRIGIEIWPKLTRERQPVGTAVIAGLRWPYDQTVAIFYGFAEIFKGKQKAEFAGPVGIVKVMKGQIAKGADWALTIMAIISVYLGLFNLLPLPALDGGRLVFLAYEGVSRRRVNQRFEQAVHMVGMIVLLGFLVYVTLGHDLGLKRLFQ